MIKKGIAVNGSSLLLLGITFKENCPDVRNTKIVDLITSLADYVINLTIYDPCANSEEVKLEYKLETSRVLPIKKFDAVVLGVAHRAFLSLDYDSVKNKTSILYDVKGFLNIKVDGRL